MIPADDEIFEAFLSAFWADVDAEEVRTLEDYLARFPGCADRIIREHEAWGRDEREKDGPPTLPGLLSAGALDTVPLREGQRIGKYLTTGSTAKGGMGVVHLGKDEELDRMVVLKTVRGLGSRDSRALARLRREARIAGRLAQDGVCPILDVVAEAEQTYIVMPFIEGRTLAEHLRDARDGSSEHPRHGFLTGKRSLVDGTTWIAVSRSSDRSKAKDAATGTGDGRPDETRQGTGDFRPVLLLVERIARTLHRVHAEGIVHRDIKPGNIMIRPDGTPVILDFGLALDDTSQSGRLTATGETVGTPLYMAPEQIDPGDRPIDARTDVFALGVILYELLTLEHPFGATTKEGVYLKTLRGEPRPPRRLNPAITRDLEAVCLKALSPSPERRYPTALALADDLRNVRTIRPTVAKPPSSAGRLLRRARRNPVTTAALLATIVLGVVALRSSLRASEYSLHLEATNALTRSVRADSRGEPPSQADLETIRTWARRAPAELREAVLADPSSSEAWELLAFELSEEPRAGTRTWRLLAPRAGVVQGFDAFTFTVPPIPAGRLHYVLTVSDANGQVVGAPMSVVQTPEQGTTLSVTLPFELDAGHAYWWDVALDTSHPAGVFDYDVQPASFHVVAPEDVAPSALRSPHDGGLSEATPFPEAVFVRVLQLQERRLAAQALALLEDDAVFAGATPAEEDLRSFMKATCWTLLDDRGNFEAERRRFFDH